MQARFQQRHRARMVDQFWLRHFGTPPMPVEGPDGREVDLADVFKRKLMTIDPSMSMEWLRTFKWNPRVVAVRKELIVAGLLAGYRGVEIARALNISQNVVSREATKMRPRLMVQFDRLPSSF